MSKPALVLLLLLTGCSSLTPEEIWASRLKAKCDAMGATNNWDQSAHTFECYRHPIGRMTKKLFSENFQ